MDKQLIDIVKEAEAYSKTSVTGYVEIGWTEIRGIEIAAYIAGATSSSTVKELEREVEMLSKLVMRSYEVVCFEQGTLDFNHDFYDKWNLDIEQFKQEYPTVFEQFKTENNL